MFPHSDLVDDYCSGSIHDNYHGLPQQFEVGTRVHVLVLPNQISWNTLHEQVDEENLPPQLARGCLTKCLDDALMLHAFDKRIISMQLVQPT